MSKGKRASIGDETVNANGYCTVKTSTGWRFKHHIVAEEKLGRPLADNERVLFRDGDRSNLDPKNLEVVLKQVRVSQTYDKRLSSLRERITLFVEEAPDTKLALSDLETLFAEVQHVFSSSV